MNEYDNIIQSYTEAGPAQATTAIGADPERATRALQLSRATGVPPLAVHEDLDRFEEDHKANLTANIVRGNSQISSYIRGNALADHVSNDDYGNLDESSRAFTDALDSHPIWGKGVPKRYIAEPLMEGLKGAIYGAAEGFTQEPFKVPENYSALSKGAYDFLGIPLRGLNAVAGGFMGGAGGLARQATIALGGDENQAARAEREARGIVESEMGRGGSGLQHADHAIGQVVRQNEALAVAKPWLDAGVDVPRGVHPLIDEIKVKTNDAWVDKIQTALDQAQNSLTKERDPELFKNFAQQHFEDAQMGISGDRVAALYGDKLPEPGDGLLGWVPGIAEKLEAARTFGEDVHVPLADWVTYMDPTLAREMKDDIRAWPGGITKNEAALKDVAAPAVDGALPQVRTSAALEPMFAIGDRPLKLEKLESKYKQMEEYNFVDHTGKVIGDITIFPDPLKKQLYIASVASHDLQPNTMGPSLVRDIKRQLKELYPDYETVTGYRISGAREEAGAPKDQRKPIVKLALSDAFEMSKEYTDLRNILDTAPTKFGDVTADIKPTELYSKHEQAIGQAVQEEINRITGKTASAVLASDIRYEGIDGIRGVYHKAPGEVAKILVSLGDFDATGIARHEAIHHLYREGFFKPEEWNALIEASKIEGWRERYDIDARYEHLNELGLHEEAIAEAFRDWAKTREQQPHNPVTTVFQKIWDLMQRIKDRVAEILGREPTFNELFEQAFTGELAQRGQGEVRPGDMFSKGEVENQLKAEAAGLDAKSFKKIQDLIQKRYQEDIQAAVKRAEAEQRTLQSKEWKEQAREVRKEAEADVRARPDVQADLLIGSGELGGKKLERNRYELRSEDLSPEQKAALPRHYYAKDGVPVDVMANLFGYSDGNHLIEALAEVNKGKEGRSAQENLKRLIDEETNRRMEEKYGKLQQNIMLDAMDQALSETNLQILSEEWQGAAMAAGVKVVDKNIAKEEALRMFGDMKLADINVERLLGIMGKIGRDTERLLIAGKNAEALVQMQRKYQTALIAAEARKLQKEQATFERTAKQFSKREVPSVDPEYTNYVHQILMQIGKPVRRSIQDLQAQIEGHGSKNLQEFVGEKAASLREIPVWDQLFDTNWSKSYDSLTTTEFRAIHDSIKALAHNGRDELKIMKQGEAENLAVVKQQMIQNVIDSAGGKFAEQNKGPIKKILMNYYVGHLQMENIFNRWDKFDSKGVWNQYIMRDLIDGANQKDAWLKEYAAKLKQLPEPEGLVRSIDNPLFKDQDTGATLPLTRKNLIAVMLNTGNSSNLAKLAKGYKIGPNDVMSWVHQHATKRDWEFVQGVWDMFSDIKSKADTMYRSLTGGVAPENIPIRPVDTPHGQFAGGYYPVIYHAEMEGKSKTLMGRDPLEQENFVRATTPAGYTKTRTGYAAPMALELDAMPGRIGQMLHDIALRPAVLNAAKVFYDHDVRSAIRAHFGAEYRDELVPYLRGVANASNYESKAQTVMNQASEFIRQNMIMTLVGLNPGTVMKHGPTAAALSIREVGAEPMAKAVRGLFSVNEATGDSNWHFAIQNSLELQRRDRNWAETLYGSATGVLAPGDKLTPWRQKIMEWSSKPVALSDMISAVPTWLAKYEGERANGASHGDAVYEADRAVRRAHGSTAITTRTAMMRNANPWMVSIYNFFSDVMNRQMEAVWKAGETKDLIKKGEWGAAAKTVPALTASLFAYAIWPAIVETYVSPHPHKDDDTWVKKSAVSMGFALGSSWVGVRDIASAMAMGRDPQFGLTGTAYQTMVNTFKDLAKNEPFNKEHAGKILQDAGIMVGGLTGMLPAQVSKAGRFMFDVSTGKENPRNTWQWLTGLRYGTTEKHPQNFTDYMKGKH